MSHYQRLKLKQNRVRAGQGEPENTEGGELVAKHIGGGWNELPGGHRVRGKVKARAELNAMLQLRRMAEK